MSSSETASGKGWWIGVPIILVLLLAVILWPALKGKDPAPVVDHSKAYLDSVTVLSWEWRDDRSGELFAVWGMVKNESQRKLSQVTLGLRAADAEGNTLSTYPIPVGQMKPGETKPFRQDVLRSGKEKQGFVTVQDVLF